ncbi:MAG: hypothetical protein GT601_17580 [Acidaminobacter sp.]|uniref:hypothetical protein n=1 Tax=Acidaminobacter sp. TaxID=1872102 RepID=UPI00137DEBCB|nr:hypothetical protein [Acidaminobacter sp.]MZQ99481.1 hypothetical protein [Acidaminobacter sp.]
MPLISNKITAFAKTHRMLDRRPNTINGMTYQQLQDWYDSSPEELRVALNGVIDLLVSTSGAANVGMTPITGVSASTVQGTLEAIKTYIDLQIQGVVAGSLPEGALNLSNAPDVNVTGVADGDALVWDTTTSKWITFAPQAKVVKGTSTITSTGWEAATGDYARKLVLTVSGITATDTVRITLDKDAHDIAQAAELCPTNESGTDTITFYAKTDPTAAMDFSYEVVK